VKKSTLYIVILFALLLLGCDRRPSYVLDEEEMTELLYDVHLMESITRCNYVPDLREKPYIYDSILKKHDVTPEQFDSCLAWYIRHSDKYLEIYKTLQDRFSKEKQELISPASSTSSEL